MFFFKDFDFSKRLRAARKEKKLTQEQLAAKISVSPATIRNYEAGKRVQPTAAVLLGLSNALDVSVDWLLGNDKYCAENAASKTASKEITKEDVKKAFQILFSAFGSTIEIKNALLGQRYVGDEIENVLTPSICFSDPVVTRYLMEYSEFYNLLSNGINIKSDTKTIEEVKRTLLDAIFPKEDFVPATSTSGGHFISDNPDDADTGGGDE